MHTVGERAITIDEVTPEWLTAVLQRAGALPSGKVTAIAFDANSAFNSHTRHLKPIYSQDAPASVPARLLLKCSLPAAWAQRAGMRETSFYQAVAQLPDHPPVLVRCFDAVYDANSGKSHLLLDDLSDTHVVPVARDAQLDFTTNLPTAAHLHRAIDALARFHAYWWEKPQLGTSFAPISWRSGSEADFTTEVTQRGQALEHLLSQESSWLSPSIKHLYETIHPQLMQLWRTHRQTRMATRANLTIAHGDAYLANFLCPRAGQAGTAYIIDWQCPEAYAGATDLVNMCATFWTREQRAVNNRELNVLRQYYRTLQENGISGYSWEDFVMDYKLSIVDWLWVPVQDCLDGADKSYWWPKLQCLVSAYEDWHVADLFMAHS